MNLVTKGPEQRYGKALFQLAQETNASKTLNGELVKLQSALDDSAELTALLQSQSVSRTEKLGVVSELVKSMKCSELLANFMNLVVSKGRADLLSGMIAWYQVFDREERGEVVATVISAEKLTKEQEEKISAFVKKEVPEAKSVVLEQKLDENLVAGMKVRVGSKEFDASLRGRMDALRIKLKQN